MDPSRDLVWQEKWKEAGLARAKRDPQREKYFALWTYPGTSGFLHLGHLRGITLLDALARYHRMRGRCVFFPTGTHASGLPAVTFAQRVARKDPRVLAQLDAHRVPEETRARLVDPEAAARYLGEEYLRLFRRMGFLFDENSYVTTIDEDYSAFIRWQFVTLRASNALRQGAYLASVCPICGPVAVDASETDLETGGDAEVLHYTCVPFPVSDRGELLAATLRPETIYGVTNLWIPTSGELRIWRLNDHNYLVSPEAADRILEQHGGELGESVPVSELIGKTARVPFTGAEVPIFSSRLVNPARGTGVVMSVPGHAPADWLAVQELPPADRRRVPAIPEIIYVDEEGLPESERKLREGSGPPAERAARAAGARTLEDEDAVESATERLYRLEFLHGRMLPAVFSPLPVPEARERLIRSFDAAGSGVSLDEFSKPVRCRNGHDVVLRILNDQWFLRYGDPEWKRTTQESLDRLLVRPVEYGRELPSVVDWFQDRPCARRGRWLGTPLPFDPSWIIEPIADSTFYPAYYVVRRYVADGRIPVAALTEAFFNFVFLGRGSGEPTLEPALQRELREEFEYWYPLDLNIGGKEHKRVHFPAFLYMHAKLLPLELRPKGILVHGYLTGPAGKISKKETGVKGGAIPSVVDAAETWGADTLRLYHAGSASIDQDFVWDPDRVGEAQRRLQEVERSIRSALEPGPEGPPELKAWLEDSVHRLLREIRESFDSLDLRASAQGIYVTLPTLMRRYLARGGAPGETLQRVAEAAIRLLVPITPHLAEELGAGRFSGLVSAEPFPEERQFPESPVARARELYLDRLEEDIQGILRPLAARNEHPRELVMYVAAPWKGKVEAWAAQHPGPAETLTKAVLEWVRTEPELASARGQIAEYVSRLAQELRSEGGHGTPSIDEIAFLRASEGYFVRRFRFDRIQVHPEESAEDVDPRNRRRRARPGRPALYLPGVVGRTDGPKRPASAG